MTTKREVNRLVEAWYYAWEDIATTPEHPLVPIQELCMPGKTRTGQGTYSARGKESRRSGRSRPPIGDLGRENDRTHRIMAHIKEIDVRFFHCMCLAVKLGSYEKAGTVAKINKTTAYRHIECGTSIFRSCLIMGLF